MYQTENQYFPRNANVPLPVWTTPVASCYTMIPEDDMAYPRGQSVILSV